MFHAEAQRRKKSKINYQLFFKLSHNARIARKEKQLSIVINSIKNINF